MTNLPKIYILIQSGKKEKFMAFLFNGHLQVISRNHDVKGVWGLKTYSDKINSRPTYNFFDSMFGCPKPKTDREILEFHIHICHGIIGPIHEVQYKQLNYRGHLINDYYNNRSEAFLCDSEEIIVSASRKITTVDYISKEADTFYDTIDLDDFYCYRKYRFDLIKSSNSFEKNYKILNKEI